VCANLFQMQGQHAGAESVIALAGHYIALPDCLFIRQINGELISLDINRCNGGVLLGAKIG